MSPRSYVCCAAALVLAAILVGAAPAGAALPPGPRLSFFETEVVVRKHLSAKQAAALGRSRLLSTDAAGHDPRPLASPSGLTVDGPTVSWAADGSEFAFAAGPTGRVEGSGKEKAYVARGDGTGVHAVVSLPGVVPIVLSPDGRWLAFTRVRKHRPELNPKDPTKTLEALTHSYASFTTWIVPTAGGRPRRLTPWGNGRFAVPSSFSPDDSTLLVSTERLGRKSEVDAIELATGKARTLFTEAVDAAYSPDGSQIAFASYRDHRSVEGSMAPKGRPSSTSPRRTAATCVVLPTRRRSRRRRRAGIRAARGSPT
jgi:hypothetical protein